MSRSSALLTVATTSHVPQALIALRSARRYGKFSSYHLFVLDAPPGTIERLPAVVGDDISFINVFGPYDLGPQQDGFLAAFKYYTAFELSCLAKYVALSRLLRTCHEDLIVYTDGDVLFVRDVSEAIEAIDDKDFLLTTHLLGPTSDATEHGFLIHGWANGGFFCIRRDSQRVDPILDWLIHRISRRGFHAPAYGLSGDQTWLSSLPFVFPESIKLSRTPALNVAYWNMEERELTRAGDGIRVNGLPLLFFHFSGLPAEQSSLLSSYSPFKVAPGSALSELCDTYRKELAAVAPLKQKMAGLERLSCSQANLQARMLTGSLQNGTPLFLSTAKFGLFTRIGQKLDLWLNQMTN